MTEDAHLATMKLLMEQPWKEVGPELVAYVEWRALRKYWRHGTDGHLALGVSAEDIVQEAITRAFEGRRNWTPDKQELVKWLKQQIDSLMYHLCMSEAHRKEMSMPATDDGEEMIDLVVAQAADHEQLTPIQAAHPEDLLLTQEKISYNESILLEAIAGDPELEEIYEAVIAMGEFNQPAIAKEMSVPVDRVYSWTRKLRRRVIRLVTITGEEHDEAKANSDQ